VVGTIRKKTYAAHRLAWALYYKEWPKKEIDHMKVTEEKRMEAIRTFFTAYAVSWRDLIRKKNALYAIEKSVHSLAEDRVDRIVPHFQEWYDAFNVKEHDALFLPVKDRLKFF
jgi:putative endopeptidase